TISDSCSSRYPLYLQELSNQGHCAEEEALISKTNRLLNIRVKNLTQKNNVLIHKFRIFYYSVNGIKTSFTKIKKL
ncbi:MAG: hypothetical protein ACTS8P_05805, partial [Arsenophonus sp. NC-XBC3-MAG3]